MQGQLTERTENGPDGAKRSEGGKDISRERDWIEWPTLSVALACFAGYGVVTLFTSQIGLWFAVPALALVLVLHASFQHEIVHGHPFRWQGANDALGFPALGLLIPYERFRDTHLAHHHDPSLTDPYEDPETNYIDPLVWNRMSKPVRAIYRFNNTLAGRMLVGPFLSMATFYRSDLRGLLRGDRAITRAYLLHGAGLVPVIVWAITMSTLPLWSYFLACYLAHAILRIRTYLEHRAHDHVGARTVVIEDRGLLAFLFLNNNFHIVHHTFPKVAWYRLPALYRATRQKFLGRNHGYRYRSYSEVVRHYLLRAKDPVAHPLRPGLLGQEAGLDLMDVPKPDMPLPAPEGQHA